MREPDMCDNLQANEERKRSLLDPSSPPFIYIHLLRRLFAQLLFNEWLKFINSSSHGNLSISFQTEIYQFLFTWSFINFSSHNRLSILFLILLLLLLLLSYFYHFAFLSFFSFFLCRFFIHVFRDSSLSVSNIRTRKQSTKHLKKKCFYNNKD